MLYLLSFLRYLPQRWVHSSPHTGLKMCNNVQKRLGKDYRSDKRACDWL